MKERVIVKIYNIYQNIIFIFFSQNNIECGIKQSRNSRDRNVSKEKPSEKSSHLRERKKKLDTRGNSSSAGDNHH